MNKIFFTNHSLPSTSAKEDLETISRNKLTALFDTSLFEVRPEIQRDKGIDLIIEIKKNNQYTNFRFAIQLKATASIKPNKNGLLSFPIKVSNLNYLMNYGMPTYYILYEHNRGDFYLEHTDHVYQNLIKKYPKKHPNSFKTSFSKLLTPELIKEIYQKTFDNGILLRRLNAHLKFPIANAQSMKGVIIDEDNEVYSLEQNIAFIEQYGLLLLNDSDYDRIIEIEQRTYHRSAASPMFNFVCGMAYFQRVNLFKAIDFLKAAQQKSTGFAPDIQATISYTLLHAKYLLGIINKQAFQLELDELMNANNIGSFLELEKAFNIFLLRKEKDPDGIQTLYGKILDLISKERDNYRLRVMAYGKILDAESKILANDLTMNSFFICGRVNDILKTKTFKQWDALCEIFEKRIDALIRFAVVQKNFQGASNIWSSKVHWAYKKIYLTHLIKNWSKTSFNLDKELDKKDMETLVKCLTDLDKIGATYEKLHDKENLVSCLFSKYELLHFLRYKQDADIVKQKVSEMIEVNDFNALKVKFNELINGDTSHEKFINSYTTHLNKIHSIVKSSGVEDEIIYGVIPEEELEFIEKSVKWSIRNFYEFDLPADTQQKV